MRRTKNSLEISSDEVKSTFEGPEATKKFPPIMTARQAAELLQVPLNTIYDWSSRGKLTQCARRVGKRLLFHRDRLVQLVFNEGVS